MSQDKHKANSDLDLHKMQGLQDTQIRPKEMDQIGSKNSEAYPLTEGCLHAPFSVTQGNPCLFNTSGVTMTLECSPGNKKKIQKRKIEKFLKRDGYP